MVVKVKDAETKRNKVSVAHTGWNKRKKTSTTTPKKVCLYSSSLQLLLPASYCSTVCMHIFSFTYTFSWHMHAHIHGHTCLHHTRTHPRSNATVVTGFCSSFPLAEFPFPLFSVPLVNILIVIHYSFSTENLQIRERSCSRKTRYTV